MNLAGLIYRALHTPQYRLALEAGAPSLDGEHASADVLAAAAEALHFGRTRSGSSTGKVLDEIFDINALTIPGWRGPER